MRRSVFQSQQAKHSRRKEDPTNALHHGSLLCSQTTSLSRVRDARPVGRHSKPTVHKNLCQKGYVWVTMVIERALFLLLAAVWVIKTHFFASRCSLGHFSAFSRLGVLLWPGFSDKMPQL